MTAEQMWMAYAGRCGISHADYDIWSFGGEPDLLARLVLEGKKTATASAFPLYEAENEPLPQAGAYSVIVDGGGQAVCVIHTDRVSTVPFRQVSAAHAWREGEGDLSLAYWRQVHKHLFVTWMAEAGLTFDWDMPVVCEEFSRVWPAGSPATI